MCWYCKEDQSTAWDLIKHVQKVHGIKCYSEPDTKPVSELDAKPVSSSEENCADLRRRSRSPEPPKAKALKLEDVKKLEIPSAFQSGIFDTFSSCVFTVFHSHKIIVDFLNHMSLNINKILNRYIYSCYFKDSPLILLLTYKYALYII